MHGALRAANCLFRLEELIYWNLNLMDFMIAVKEGSRSKRKLMILNHLARNRMSSSLRIMLIAFIIVLAYFNGLRRCYRYQSPIKIAFKAFPFSRESHYANHRFPLNNCNSIIVAFISLCRNYSSLQSSRPFKHSPLSDVAHRQLIS